MTSSPDDAVAAFDGSAADSPRTSTRSRVLSAGFPTPLRKAPLSGTSAHHIEQAENDVAGVQRFIAGWCRNDRYDRFGSQNDAVACWLIERFGLGSQRGLVARAGAEIVALLDFAKSGRVHEVGLFVASGCRRAGIGTALLRRLVEREEAGLTLVAECRRGNVPATSFLAACGFSVVFTDGGETRWILCGRAIAAGKARRDEGMVPRLVGCE